MRILLLQPPLPSSVRDIAMPPLGLACVASSAIAAGHDVEILDAWTKDLDYEETCGWIQSRVPWDLIGVSATTPVFSALEPQAERLARFCRWLVLGGAHISALAMEGELVLPAGFDFGVIGEGETSFVELLGTLAGGFDPSKELPQGVFAPGRPFRPRSLPEDLVRLPPPARHLVAENSYVYPFAFGRLVSSTFTSRGCPYGCVFCDHAVFGRKIRFVPVSKVLEDLSTLVSAGIEYVVFFDELFTLDSGRVAKICAAILRRGWKFGWKCEGRVDTIETLPLDLMKRAGCECIALGIESANPGSLKFLGKRTTPELTMKAVRLIRMARIRVMGYFILGIPGETWENAIRTIRFAKVLKCDYAQFSSLAPLPGTPLKRWAKQMGVFFEARAGNPFDFPANRPGIRTGIWNEKSLSEILRTAYRSFFLSPGYLVRRLLGIRSWGEFKTVFRSGLGVLGYALGRTSGRRGK